MKSSSQSSHWGRAPREMEFPNSGFTLVDLLMVIAVTGFLAVMLLPALANVQNKGGRAQCAANFRQIYTASMIYAGENNNWLPICTVGAGNPFPKFNNLSGMHYSRYVYLNGPQNSPVPTNAAIGWGSSTLQNMGYLYRVGLAGNGQIFFCPANWGSIVGANTYSPLLTTDNFGSGFGQVRSTYLYNPRVVKVDPNFAADSSNDKRARRYQKSPDLEPHKLFAVDYMEQNSPAGGMPATQIAHIRERGWNVLFTDGSVQFSQNKTAYVAITTRLISDESHQSFWWYETAFNYLELDH